MFFNICLTLSNVHCFFSRLSVNLLFSFLIMSKIIPNKLSPLTYYLLEHYNDHLKCEVCNHTWSADGTAFSKDQAGTKNGMYYRYFLCKGKAKGKCSALY